jgi:hypothetical protein
MLNCGECRREILIEPVHELYCGKLAHGEGPCSRWSFRPAVTARKI